MKNEVNLGDVMAAPVGEREAFEAHMRIGGYSNPDKHPDGSYVSSVMELWWQGWKARAAYQRQSGVVMAHERERRIYIAGPMTGIENFNFPAFNTQADSLRTLGYHVENPADHGVVDGAEWADYLRYDLSRLATCEAIFLLPGWEKSSGARLEVHVGKALGITFIHHADALNVDEFARLNGGHHE